MDVETVTGEETVGGDSLADALAHRIRAVAAGIRQDQSELVAAEARHHVGLARAAANDRGRLDQCAAAGQMPMRVVDRLEAVQVDKEQRERPSAARRALGFATQDLIQIPRVVQVREIVGNRQRLRPFQNQRVVERD